MEGTSRKVSHMTSKWLSISRPPRMKKPLVTSLRPSQLPPASSQLFEKMDVLALHLAVADQIEGRGQTGETGADDIGGFLVHALRLFGMGKGFISSCRVIHNQ